MLFLPLLPLSSAQSYGLRHSFLVVRVQARARVADTTSNKCTYYNGNIRYRIWDVPKCFMRHFNSLSVQGC